MKPGAIHVWKYPFEKLNEV
jgi:WD40 repeat protein